MKTQNICKSIYTLLKKSTSQKSRENRKNFLMNHNENKAFRYLWDIDKTVLRGKFIALNIYIGKRKKT